MAADIDRLITVALSDEADSITVPAWPGRTAADRARGPRSRRIMTAAASAVLVAAIAVTAVLLATRSPQHHSAPGLRTSSSAEPTGATCTAYSHIDLPGKRDPRRIIARTQVGRAVTVTGTLTFTSNVQMVHAYLIVGKRGARFAVHGLPGHSAITVVSDGARSGEPVTVHFTPSAPGRYPVFEATDTLIPCMQPIPTVPSGAPTPTRRAGLDHVGLIGYITVVPAG